MRSRGWDCNECGWGDKARAFIERLEVVHDGLVTDYVTWLTLGAAVLGALFALSVR